MQTSSNDRFGFYTVGDFKTYSKLEAIEHSGVAHQPVEWNFNKEIFEKFDWTQEPPGSLEFWYGERARQIRDKYDYFVLWYSGGADSHNALMSFVKNNIFIDEIAQFHNLAGTNGDKQSWLNEEVFATSAPVTQELIQNNPVYKHTNHRLVDLSELEMDVLTKDSNKFDYFYKVGKYLSPNSLARSYMRETIPDYRDLIDQGKSVCFIYGAEKPLVTKKDKWHIEFTDCIDYAVSPRTQMLNNQWEHNELFYWADELPQIAAKQAHIIRRYMSQLTPDMVDNINVLSGPIVRDKYGRFANIVGLPCITATVNGKKYHLTSNGLSRIIYPYWTPGAIVCAKPASLAFSDRDTWMFKSNSPEVGQNNYFAGLFDLRSRVKKVSPSYWWEWQFDRNIAPYSGGMTPLKNIYYLE
jgi:hypothetical protein